MPDRALSLATVIANDLAIIVKVVLMLRQYECNVKHLYVFLIAKPGLSRIVH